jgi:deoxyadenosine/deoxycytidine kinase
MPKPDCIFICIKIQNLQNKRGRSYEQKIPGDYLDKINSGFLDYIKSQTELKCFDY